MQLDVNHDGTMDTSFAGPDNTSAGRPFLFWVNDDDDSFVGTNITAGQDVDSPQTHDFALGRIHSVRDLEDYARLWICGVPALTNSGYQVTLQWTNIVGGNPSIELFNAVETNGGTGYLTNTNTAIAQATSTNLGSPYSPVFSGWGASIGTVTNGTPFVFSTNYFTNNAIKYLLFEGAGIGQGELVMTISRNGTNIVSTSAFIDLHDIKTMYERATANNVTDAKPPSSLVSTLQLVNILAANPTESKQMIVFVHGINNTPWDYENTSETMFKRGSSTFVMGKRLG